MNVTKIAIGTLITLSTLSGLQSTAFADSRLDYLNKQVGLETAIAQLDTSTSPSTQKENTQPVMSKQMSQNQREAKSQKEDEINIKDIYPEYCRSFISRRSGTLTSFEYSEILERCKQGGS
jgi:hypothetical protein